MIVVFALAFLALHLPYLPSSLEDLDSINFALGIRRFDVARHQPHPPGYPVFILIGKALHAAGLPEVTALALIGAGAGTLGVLALWVLFCRLGEGDTPHRWLVAAAAVAMTTPLYWLTAVRPLSDTSGLAAALAIQAMALGAADPRSLAIAAFCAGLAAGLRSQVIWLTVPLLIVKGLGPWGLGPAERPGQPASRPQFPALVMALLTGIAVWFVPLVILTGGPTAYWHALSDQGAEDLGSIQMLWTRHGMRDVSEALYYAFVAPWAAWPVAVVALAAAWAGLGRLATRQRRTLALLMVAFLPYLAFDLLFQESFTSRYALPLVVPMAYLIVAGLRLVPWDLGLPVAAALAMYCAHIGGTSIAAYSRAKAPAFRLLDDMRAASANAAAEPPVLAADRRESFDLRGPRKWLGEATPRISAMLEAPPQHEWLEAVKYWNGGGRAPLWFVVDPARAAVDLVQHGEPLRYRWALGYPVLLSGVRPNEMDWYRVDQPEWYVGEGWALTPEAAGVADADGRDPAHGPITGWVRGAAVSGGTLMIGGRSFDPAQRPRLTVTIGPDVVIDETLMPGAFLRFASLPSARRDAAAPAYDAVTVTTTAAAKVAVEQFDVSATRPLIGFGMGWHEQEFNPRTGRRWRWLSQRGELNVVAEPVAVGPNAIRPHPGGHLTLHLEGESPRTYFPRGSRLVIRSGGRVVFDEVLSSDFSRDVPLDGIGETIVLETDQTYAPAERSRRTPDRRRLGLRMFSVRITRVS
ncbi:MAG TPA: hypothetical protein VHT95_10940 [Vicinamibacterales bacterium]|nr:hypothetical protein [Vicinamibacterales bacterium]